MKNPHADLIERLAKLAKNLWWSWNYEAVSLFTSVDPPLFAATNQNPIRTLKLLAPHQIAAIECDADFLARLESVERQLSQYLSARTWYESIAPKTGRKLKIAYFCAEFAIHESLPQYSGGLGVLAGDHVKSASDLGIPLIGIGLLYRNGFYTQKFAPDGSTRVIYPELDFAELPITDTGIIIDVPISNRVIAAKIWRQTVGRVSLFLLDTDIPRNKPADRALTHHLYGGDREYRIKQEILLGVGGVIALDAVGQTPTVVHMNEGHAAFAALERVVRDAQIDRSAPPPSVASPIPASSPRTRPSRPAMTASIQNSRSNTSAATPTISASASRTSWPSAARIPPTSAKNFA